MNEQVSKNERLSFHNWIYKLCINFVALYLLLTYSFMNGINVLSKIVRIMATHLEILCFSFHRGQDRRKRNVKGRNMVLSNFFCVTSSFVTRFWSTKLCGDTELVGKEELTFRRTEQSPMRSKALSNEYKIIENVSLEIEMQMWLFLIQKLKIWKILHSLCV